MMRKLILGSVFLATAFLGGAVGSWALRPESPEASVIQPLRGRSTVVGTFGVGGVLTASGNLYQYRPDKKAWTTLDESFALEGKATQIAPLPVPVGEVRIMETFGFLVTHKNECWLYNINENRWESIGAPPAG